MLDAVLSVTPKIEEAVTPDTITVKDSGDLVIKPSKLNSLPGIIFI